MEKKTLYFLRHAQSVYNKEGLIQGDIDTPLSKEGRDVTKEKAVLFKQFGFKNIARSPLMRAEQTAEIINEELNLPIKVYENLKEMDFGKWSAEMKIENWDEYRRDFYEHGKPPPGGESKHEIYKRAEKEVMQLCNDIDKDPILVVAHGMLLRVLLGEWFTNSTEKEIRALKMSNLTLYKVEVEYDKNHILPKSNKYIDIEGTSEESRNW